MERQEPHGDREYIGELEAGQWKGRNHMGTDTKRTARGYRKGRNHEGTECRRIRGSPMEGRNHMGSGNKRTRDRQRKTGTTWGQIEHRRIRGRPVERQEPHGDRQWENYRQARGKAETTWGPIVGELEAGQRKGRNYMEVDDRGIKDRPQEDRDLSNSLQAAGEGVVDRKNRQSSGRGRNEF